MRADGHAIDHVDVGGGLGIPYHEGEDAAAFHPERYADLARKHLGGLGVTVVLEPGRLLVGNAGILVTAWWLSKRARPRPSWSSMRR